ncbi:MAG TPA: RNase adapter RapZ [Haliangiales bacterium]|nr:RNase adapter RapZ [Haliangiales bacterium]
MRIVVVTGVSGAGKSTAVRALEDLDFFCVDNLPLPLVEKFVELISAQGETNKAGLVIDAREGEFLTGVGDVLRSLKAKGHPVEVLFLDASDDALFRRFSETRRRHPLADDDLRAGIAQERQMLKELREEASAVVDTTHLNVHQLKGIIQERYGRATGALSLTLLSFGYKHGLPAEADIVLDVRFLPNPYFIEALSAHTGLDADVARFVLGNDDAAEFTKRIEDLLTFSLPRFEREGKAYVTIALGCTGGRHRSVAVAEELGRRFGSRWSLTIRHRDIERGANP